MPSRRIQALNVKMKRMRRLAPRYLFADYIPTGKPPDRFVIAEYKERAKGLAFDDEYAKYLVRREQLKGMFPHPGREEVKAHMERIKATAPNLQCVNFEPRNPARKILMFYNQERSRFILFEDNAIGCFIRTSLPYMDRDRCVRAYRTDTVRWVYFSSVHPPSHSEPT